MGEKVIVGIGSSENSGEENNPYDYKTRSRMVEKVLESEGIDNVVGIVPIRDFPEDDDWAREVMMRVSEVIEVDDWSSVVVVGNNEWTNDVLAGRGMQVYETGLKNRDELEGVKIRKLMSEGDNGWEERVPEEVVKVLGC